MPTYSRLTRRQDTAVVPYRTLASCSPTREMSIRARLARERVHGVGVAGPGD